MSNVLALQSMAATGIDRIGATHFADVDSTSSYEGCFCSTSSWSGCVIEESFNLA